MRPLLHDHENLGLSSAYPWGWSSRRCSGRLSVGSLGMSCVACRSSSLRIDQGACGVFFGAIDTMPFLADEREHCRVSLPPAPDMIVASDESHMRCYRLINKTVLHAL